MTTPIDLDLVELRCKLRGWLYYRDPEDRYVEMPAHGLTVYPSGHFDRFGPHAAKAGPFTRPRLTLTDIIADPGEGWFVSSIPFEGHGFYWGDAGPNTVIPAAWVGVDAEGKLVSPAVRYFTKDMAALIVAHRAVTDLLIRLAEVPNV